MRLFLGLMAAALIAVSTPAAACSPAVNQLSFKQKAEASDILFIGGVEEAGDDYVIFRVAKSGKGAPAAGETIRLAHQGYGTCGELKFETGDVWLYAGDSPMGASRKIEEKDMEAEIAAVVERLDSEGK